MHPTSSHASTSPTPPPSPASFSPLWLARSSPAWFAYLASEKRWKPAAHLRLVSDKLVDIAAGRCKRLIITLPPRHGKSSLVSGYFPAWYLGNFPRNRVILTSYESRYAASWGRKARDIFKASAPTYFGVNLSSASTASEYWETELGGTMVTAGVGGPITGKGGHIVIVDDPVKNDAEADSARERESMWDWYQSTLYTRLESDPEGSIVVMLTRWHEDDLAGRLIAAQGDGGDQWEVVNLPAIAEPNDALGREVGAALWPARFPVDRLERIKKAQGGGRWWWALYQQRPQPAEGSVFKASWLCHVDSVPDTFDQIVQCWDTAIKGGQHNDFSACVTIGVKGNLAYVIGVWRGRIELPGLLTAMKAQAARWSPSLILVEDTANGTAAMQTLRMETRLPLVPVQPKGDKVARANIIVPYMEGGRLMIGPGAWRGDFANELLSFPLGTNDDQVDAFVHVLTRIFVRGGALIR